MFRYKIVLFIGIVILYIVIGNSGVQSQETSVTHKIVLHKNYLVLTNFSEEWLKEFASNNEFSPIKDWVLLGSSSIPAGLHLDVRKNAGIDDYWKIESFSWGSKDGWKLVYLNPDKNKIVIAW